MADEPLSGCPGSSMPRPAIWSWARREACARLLSDWLKSMGAGQWTTRQQADASSTPFELWLRADQRAEEMRKRLGLDLDGG